MNLATYIIGTIPFLIHFYANIYLEEDKTATGTELEKDLSLPTIKNFDFIVVGGGSAGCVIAGRLSERFNVLLLEAGGKPVPATQVPYFYPFVGHDPVINYYWPTVPQRFASRDTGGMITTHLGMMLGGSGSYSGMFHNRGNPKDYDNYARILNGPSWRYENVLQFFKKNEDFIGRLFTFGNNENYGHGGPITVNTDIPPFFPIWVEIGRELGFRIGDANGFQTESFTAVPKAVVHGQRSSSYNQYIKPHLGTRQTLTVHPYSMATKVLIDGNKKAYGVVYERHGIPQIAHASKEVIISCGTYSSPLLLMKSGIGPRDQLEAGGIPVKLELPFVGQNLGDHLLFTLWPINYNSSSILPYIPLLPNDQDFQVMLEKYHESGEGILGTSADGPQAFVVSSRAKNEGQGDWPDIHLIHVPVDPTTEGDEDKLPTSFTYIFVTRPKFRGTVTLNATAYKRDAASDMDVLFEGIELMFKMINTKAMKQLKAFCGGDPHSACGAQVFLSREYWKCVIIQTVITGYHSVGTYSLGSVVDLKFRVQGISNLRVADASVLVVPPNANTNAPVMMIAEKAANDIMQTWLSHKY